MDLIGRFWAIVEIVRALIQIYREVRAYVDRSRQAERDERLRKQLEHIDKVRDAKTETEIWESQDGVVDNRPR
jgi:alpha-glucuronidase